MTNIETAIALKQELDALRPISPEQEAKIWQKFRFDWNYHSNNIEGNSLTFGETKALLLHNITAQGKPLKDHLEITGHNEAIKALLSFTNGDEPLTESFIRNLHVMILRERFQSHAVTADGAPTTKWIEVGQYKTLPNHVQTSTGEIFPFAEPIDVPYKMRELVEYINGNSKATDIAHLVAAAKVHYDFVRIHPFDDGNGRMARLLMSLVLIGYGFPPAIIKTEDKENYFAALRQADGDQFNVFVEYIAGCVSASLKIMLAGARGESIEDPDGQDRQIKMLAKLIEQKSGKLSTVRSLESITKIFTESVTPLALALESAARKFSSMYADTAINMTDNHAGMIKMTGEGVTAQIGRLQPNIDIATTQFQFTAQFSSFKFPGGGPFTQRWEVTCTLISAGYEIKSNPPSAILNKSYDQALSPEEIRSFVAQLTAAHIQAIEQVSGVSLGAL